MGSSHWAAPFFFVPPPLQLENSGDQRVDAAYESWGSSVADNLCVSKLWILAIAPVNCAPSNRLLIWSIDYRKSLSVSSRHSLFSAVFVRSRRA